MECFSIEAHVEAYSALKEGAMAALMKRLAKWERTAAVVIASAQPPAV